MMQIPKAAALLAAALAVLPLQAQAACSRPVNVPIAPLGVSVVVRQGHVDGIFPDMLRALGKKVGCQFNFSVVPRARLEMLFSTNAADLLIVATKSPERDKAGQFVPLFKYRATLISVKPLAKPIQSLEQVAQDATLRVVVVRGFDYGPAYRKLLAQLGPQRLAYAADGPTVLRMLQSNMADVTILPPTSAYAAARADARLNGVPEKLQFAVMEEMPWEEAGVYVSNKALPELDQVLLIYALRQPSTSELVMKGYQAVFPPSILDISTRPF